MFLLAKKNLFLIVIIDNNVDNNSNYQKQEKETLIDHRCWLLSVFNAVILHIYISSLLVPGQQKY